jgi:uncharacterized protein (DUF362 family)
MNDHIYKVSLASASDRYHTVFSALSDLTTEINALIEPLDERSDYILIKPNCVASHQPKCATHVDAIRSILDFLSPLWDGRVILAEGSAENTIEAFNSYGYVKLKPDYPKLEFLDLNYSDAIFVDILDKNLKPMTVKISNTVAEAPLRISIGPPKTHDSVIFTASVKNMAVGSILKEDRPLIHQGNRAINRSIAKLYEYTYPHLAVIDGFCSMEGNGPIHGKLVETKFAAASTNAVAADTLVAQMLGFNPVEIGYLNLLGAPKMLNQIKTVGAEVKNFQFHLKPHKSYLDQLNWL